jgi:hypothetical protein
VADQYDGKAFENVKRKGKVRSRRVIVPTEARAALDRYLKERDETAGSTAWALAGFRKPGRSAILTSP